MTDPATERAFILLVRVQNPTREQARDLKEKIDEISDGNYEVATLGGSGVFYLFRTGLPPQSVKMTINQGVSRFITDFVLVELGEQFATYGFGKADMWLQRNL